MQLTRETRMLLEDLEERICPETEDDFIRQWRVFLAGEFSGEIFCPVRNRMTSPGYQQEPVLINDALEDLDLMLRHQLLGVSSALSSPSTNICIRANYGTGILSSLFGAELYIMPREMETLPTTRSIGDTEKIRALVEAGMPDLRTGLGARVFDFGEFCQEVLRPYPKVSRYVRVYHPDTQGPLDIAELLWGEEMFYAMYDEPELVHGLVSLIMETYVAFMEKWFRLYPPGEMNPHWGQLWHRGHILLRDDSAMNLSPDLYREYAAPYDGTLLKKYGGVVHFCGRGDHYMTDLTSLDGLYGINMSQPEYNDMETIYRCTVDRGIPLLGFSKERAEQDVSRPGGFHHLISSIQQWV